MSKSESVSQTVNGRFAAAGGESASSTVNIDYLIGFAGETKSKTVKWTDIKFDKSRPSPQAEIATRVLSKLPGITHVEWDRFPEARKSFDIVFISHCFKSRSLV